MAGTQALKTPMQRCHVVAIVVFLAACSAACSERASDSTDMPANREARSAVTGDFTLVRIGRESVTGRTEALRRCDDRPFFSRYLLRESTWSSVDSVLSPCATAAQRVAQAIISSGHFVARGDTLDFYVPDARIGERGLVERGIVYGDTLLLWGSDLDGGDYTYVRKRRSEPDPVRE